jgi:hypothetical protein
MSSYKALLPLACFKRFGKKVQANGHRGGQDFQNEGPTSRICGCQPTPRRIYAASDHCRTARRRNGGLLPRSCRCWVGEPVAEPQPSTDLADSQPDAITNLAYSQPDAITNLADRFCIAHPDSDPESRSDPRSDQQASTGAQPNSESVAQFPTATGASSDTRADIARRAFPGSGSREESAPGQRRILGARNYPSPGTACCPLHRERQQRQACRRDRSCSHRCVRRPAGRVRRPFRRLVALEPAPPGAPAQTCPPSDQGLRRPLAHVACVSSGPADWQPLDAALEVRS